MVPNAGLTVIAGRIKGTGLEPHHIGWGIGTTDPAVGNSGLENAAAEDRTEGTSSVVTVTTASDTYQVTGTVTIVTVGKTITEVCLFNAATAGEILIRATHTPQELGVGEGIAYTIKVTAFR